MLGRTILSEKDSAPAKIRCIGLFLVEKMPFLNVTIGFVIKEYV